MSIFLKMKYLLLASRPKTLVAAVLPVGLAGALSFFELNVFVPLYFWSALGAIVGLQVATNFFNDAIDFKKGADDSSRLGPKRAAQMGWLGAKELFLWGAIFLGFSVVTSLPVLAAYPQQLIPLAVISLFLAYSYTGGPFPLAYLGLGELFVFVFFGIVATGGAFFVHTGKITESSLVLALQVGCFSTALIMFNNLRDINGDRKNGKKTMAVRCGERIYRYILVLVLLCPMVLNFYWVNSFSWYFLLLLPAPITLYLGWSALALPPSKRMNFCLSLSALVFLCFSLVFLFLCVF